MKKMLLIAAMSLFVTLIIVVESQARGVNLNSTTIGNMTYTRGYAGDEYMSLNSTKIGDFTYTRGYIGDERVSINSMSVGDMTYTSGNIYRKSTNCNTLPQLPKLRGLSEEMDCR